MEAFFEPSDREESTLTPSGAASQTTKVSQLHAPPLPDRRPPQVPLDVDYRPYSPSQPSEPFPALDSPWTQSSQLGEYEGSTARHSHSTSIDDMYPEPELLRVKWAQQPSSPSMMSASDTDSYFSRNHHLGHGKQGERSNWIPRMKSSDTTMTVWPSVIPSTTPRTSSPSERGQKPSSYFTTPSLGTVNSRSSDCKYPIASQFMRKGSGGSDLRHMLTEEKMSEIDAYLGLGEDGEENGMATTGKRGGGKEGRGKLKPVGTTGRNIARSGINTVTQAVHRALERVDRVLR
ncbi:hypothetical protein B0T16DRAFT_459291 [Cercophora newfieldiana]|uniref:Uncharacterized protein n=1 Tax=Cercophora newfieldiana TaxID=92897 RepID=A0AA39XZD0_9PEZI|nr:hypothetical protein B0T16DRAFT_459291 [Cercophora newfieldiana]